MLRSAAKNHERVAVVVDPADYARVLAELDAARRGLRRARASSWRARRSRTPRPTTARSPSHLGARSTTPRRRRSRDFPETLHVSAARWRARCATARTRTSRRRSTRRRRRRRARRWRAREVLQGKELSYNNLLDLDAALRLVRRVRRAGGGDRQAQQPVRRRRSPTTASPTPTGARARPIRCRRSAASSRSTAPVDGELGARARRDVPRVRDRARRSSRGALRDRWPRRRTCACWPADIAPRARRARVELRSVAGGFARADARHATSAAAAARRSSSKRAPTADELRDLDFAWRVCKHVKSNAIVFARGRRARSAIGAGQMSRVDSVQIARVEGAARRWRARSVASDAFFPFRDGVDAAAKAGAAAVDPAGRLGARRRGRSPPPTSTAWRWCSPACATSGTRRSDVTAAAVQPGPWRRRLRRTAAALGVIVALGLGFMIVDGWRAFGHRATGARRARMERSPQWKDGHFENPQPLVNDAWGAVTAMFHASPDASPAAAGARRRPIDPARFATPPATGLRVTWLGHSTMLIEIDGHRVLTDPVWSERASPLTLGRPAALVPRRRIALAALPPIDAVVISHDHYDHLDHADHRRDEGLADDHASSCRSASARTWRTGACPRRASSSSTGGSGRGSGDAGDRLHARAPRVGAHVLVRPRREAVGGLRAHRRRATAPTSRATPGCSPAMRDIGARLGPFDVDDDRGRAVPPRLARLAHRPRAGGARPRHGARAGHAADALGPVHARAARLDRADRARAGGGSPAGRDDRDAAAGRSVEPEAPPAVGRWWPAVPWVTAAQDPIVSTKVN